MTKYLQRQKKSVISGTGFKRHAGMLLVFMLLFTAMLSGNEMVQEENRVLDSGRDLLFAASSIVENDQYLAKEAMGQRAELLGSKDFRQFTRLMQNRMNPLAAVMLSSVLPELFKQYFSMSCKKRDEILSRSLMIVQYIRNADGKKNEISASIK